jgi:hypothetical protein
MAQQAQHFMPARHTQNMPRRQECPCLFVDIRPRSVKRGKYEALMSRKEEEEKYGAMRSGVDAHDRDAFAAQRRAVADDALPMPAEEKRRACAHVTSRV